MSDTTTPAAHSSLAIATRPRFRRHVSVEIVAGQGVVLYGERGAVILAGALNERLATLLDGRRTVDDIIDVLNEDFPPAEIYYALMALARDRFLTEGTDADDPPGAAFWDSIGVNAGASPPTVSVHATLDEDRRLWSAELLAHGFGVQESANLTLVIVPDYLDASLAAFNAEALADGRSWLLCRPAGTELWIGPLFVPGASACWECLRHRLARNQPVRAFLARRTKGAPVLPRTGAPWTHQAAVGLITTQLARIQSHGPPDDFLRNLIVLDTLTMESTGHAVARRPQCPACGDTSLVSQRAGQELTLSPRTKAFTADGGHRVKSPGETIEQLSRLVDPLTGVITELRRLPYDNPSIQVFTSGLNGANAHRDLTGLHAGLRRSSSGKGFTEAQARASALGEAVERHSAIFQGDEPRLRATFRELGERALHPLRSLLYSESQYATAHLQAASATREEWVPDRFDETATIDWSPIWSMTERRTKYLPTALLYIGHRSPTDHVFGLGDSNGNAAGNTLEEAVLQGFLELVERDSTALWWYNRVRRPAVDLDSLNILGWEQIRDYYRTIGRELWLLDITADLGIPTLVAVSRFTGRPREEILLGLGTHLDSRIAASRAISEMNQMLAALEALRTGVGVNHTLASWLANATLENQPYLVPAQDSARRLVDLPYIEHSDLLDDVLWCQRAVEAIGLEMLVLDQTRPDVNMPVVKVVVPEMRHFRPRFAPGRLYDVPVELGWMPRPANEPELNPVPFFL